MENKTKQYILSNLPKAITDAEELAKDRKAGMLNDDDEFIKKAEQVGQAIVDVIQHLQMDEWCDREEAKENAKKRLEELKKSKMKINCSKCGKPWLVGDRERTEKEKKEWVCPDCLNEQGENRDSSDKFDENPIVDEYDKWRDNELTK